MQTTFLRHEDDPPLMSSVGTIKQESEQSFLWLDIKTFLEMRIEDHRDQLEKPENASRMLWHQAIIANCRDILALPERFIEELTTEEVLNG